MGHSYLHWKTGNATLTWLDALNSSHIKRGLSLRGEVTTTCYRAASKVYAWVQFTNSFGKKMLDLSHDRLDWTNRERVLFSNFLGKFLCDLIWKVYRTFVSVLVILMMSLWWDMQGNIQYLKGILRAKDRCSKPGGHRVLFGAMDQYEKKLC